VIFVRLAKGEIAHLSGMADALAVRWGATHTFHFDGGIVTAANGL
jgi:hypothetical protein